LLDDPFDHFNDPVAAHRIQGRFLPVPKARAVHAGRAFHLAATKKLKSSHWRRSAAKRLRRGSVIGIYSGIPTQQQK